MQARLTDDDVEAFAPGLRIGELGEVVTDDGVTLQDEVGKSSIKTVGNKAYVCSDCDTYVWDLGNGQRIAELPGKWMVTPTYAIQISDKLRVWDLNTNQLKIETNRDPYTTLGCRDARYFVISYWKLKYWQVWDATTVTPIMTVNGHLRHSTIAGDFIFVDNEDGQITQHNITNGSVVRVFHGSPHSIMSMAYSTKYLMVNLWNHEVCILDIHTGQLVANFFDTFDWIGKLAISDEYAVIELSNGALKVYHILTKSSGTIYPNGGIKQILFAGDDLVVFTPRSRQTYKLWYHLLTAFVVSLAVGGDGDGAIFRLLCNLL